MTPPVRIAQLSCGPEYSGVQHEINTAAKEVNGEIFYPDIALKDVLHDFDIFGLDVRSPDLKLAIARAKALVEGRVEADAVFIATCFRCAEGADREERTQALYPRKLKAPGGQLLLH